MILPATLGLSCRQHHLGLSPSLVDIGASVSSIKKENESNAHCVTEKRLPGNSVKEPAEETL